MTRASRGANILGVILFVGDSHMEALGPRLTRTFEDSAFIAHRGKGVPAFLSAGWLADAIRQYNPDTVVIAVGGNDGHSRDIPRYQAQVAELVAQGASQGAQVLWVGPGFATRGDVQRRHAWAGNVIQGTGVSFYDSMPVTRTGHRDDGVHFRPSAYDRWAEGVSGFVENQSGVSPIVVGAAVGVGAIILAWLLRPRAPVPPTPVVARSRRS